MLEGLKETLIVIAILIVIGYIFSLLGFDGGRGGNPQESYQEEYYIEDY